MTRMLVAGLMALAAVSLAGIGLAQTGDTAPQLTNVAVTEGPQGLAVNIGTSRPTRYQVTLMEAPPRIVIDMDGTYAAARMRWASKLEPIHEIRGSQWKPGTARLVVELTRPVAYHLEESPGGLTLAIARDQRPESAKAGTSTPPGKPASQDKPTEGLPGESAKTATAKSETAKGETLAPSLSSAVISRADMLRDDTPSPPAMAKSATANTAAPDADLLKPLTKSEQTAAAEVDTPPASVKPPVRVAQAQRGSATTPPAPASEGQIRSTTNGTKLLTLDFKDADVVNVLRLLAAEGGRNIAVGDDVKGKVTVSLRNVTWDQALDTILEARGLAKIEKAGVIRIVSNEQLAKEREAQARADDAKRKAEIDARTKMAEAQVKEQEAQQRRLAAEAVAAEALARGPLKEEVIRLSYADAGEVGNTLQGVLGLGVAPILPCRLLQGGQATGTTGGGSSSPVQGPIAAPPFSALFGPPQQPEIVAGPPISPEVVANRLTIRTHCPTNSLFLRLFAANLDRTKTLIREYLDVPLPQVKIEARMEILDRTALEALGIQWGGGGIGNAGKSSVVGQGFGQPNQGGGIPPSNFTPSNPNLIGPGNSLLPISPVTGLPTGANIVNLPLGAFANAATAVPTAGWAFGIVGSNFNINLALQALNELDKTHTLARPEIVTVENNKATISLGEELPYATVSSAGTQIQFKEALLKLEVTPTVIREKITGGRENTKIKMVVVVENNDRGADVNLGTNGTPPAINKRKAETIVLMNEGERLVIGGVTTALNQNTVRKVPGMGDIPVLGWLFKAKSDSAQGRELVVFVTPSVLKPMLAGSVPGR